MVNSCKIFPFFQIPPDQAEDDDYEYEDDFFEETPSELANVSRIPMPSNNNSRTMRSNASSVVPSSVASEPVSRRYTKA